MARSGVLGVSKALYPRMLMLEVDRLSQEQLPTSLREVWEMTRRRLSENDATGWDAELARIGDAVVATGQEPESMPEQMVWRAWKTASPEMRHQLAELWIKTVGHGEFPQE